MKKHPSVVVIGGGTGTFTLLSGLRDNPVEITALLTMVDDGGSNRVLRDEFGLLPTSGVRQAIVALSEQHTLLRELFMYRFHQGVGLSGMTFGNLFLAAVTDIVGSQKDAIQQTCTLLNVKGTVLPISYDNVRLVARYEDGSEVVGEHLIDEPVHDGKLRITGMTTYPAAHISDEAKEAIANADMIVLGPGDFFTNTVANLVIEGVSEAIVKSKAELVFIANLMTKYGEAYNYKASDYLKDLGQYLPIERLNTCIINSDIQYSKDVLELYRADYAIPVENDIVNVFPDMKVVATSLRSKDIVPPQKGDQVHRGIVRHDSEKLAQALLDLLK